MHGAQEGVVDDFVVRRNDGAPAYNLAVIVDDAWQGIGEVVRGDDLLETTPRQLFLAAALGLDAPAYAHVPLVLGPDGSRLAKRHGAVTLDQLDAGAGAALDGGDAGHGRRHDRGGDAARASIPPRCPAGRPAGAARCSSRTRPRVRRCW